MDPDAILALTDPERLEEAVSLAEAAVSAYPASASAYARLGALLALSNRHADAAKALGQAIAIDPGSVEALNNFGAVLRAVGKADAAQRYFERALDLSPAFHDALANAMKQYLDSGRLDEGAARAAAAIAAGDGAAETWLFLGMLRMRQGRETDARHAFERAIEIEPENAEAWQRLAECHLTLGDAQAAREAILKAIELAPNRPAFYRTLTANMRDMATTNHRAALEAFVADTALDSEDRLEAHFALGDLEQAAKNWNAAFDHYIRANALLRSLTPYDEETLLRRFEDIEQVFSREMIARGAVSHYPSELPVFIIGMPRSGTTLVEQIIASHPSAVAGGELELFHQFTLDEFATPGPVGAALAQRYVRALSELATPLTQRVTDKMPGNFMHAGLISMTLPRARLIHVRRDPLDTCWSCFSTRFTEKSMIWSSDIGTLGRYYRAYEKIMQHWRDALPPGFMLEVQYEELVADFEMQARRIIAYCGLEWDDRCLEFHKTQRPVHTASVSQVRKPLYSTSVGRSRAYGELLRPLADALGVDL
ncbi:MAG TPA: sulfotransferase [Candidatus Aquilonibacter sp.]|nr:sulfotransferase [Candidatus Aquilonibacter sp.]